MPAPVFPATVKDTYDITEPRLPNCSQPIDEGWKVSTLTQTFDSGHEQRRQKAEPRRTFSLQYVVLSQKEYFTIRDFFLQVTNVTAFTWLHPLENISILCRFDMDTFAGTYFSHGPSGPLYKLQLKLMQVWS